MKQQASKRNRGVILTTEGWDKFKAAKNQAEENSGNSFTLEELSERMGLSLHTISKIQGGKEPVDKSSLQCAFAAFKLELCKSDYQPAKKLFEQTETQQGNPQYSLEEAPDVSVFYGRDRELLQLRKWMLEDRCRLIGLLGIGGIGKSTLAAKLGTHVQAEFEVVVWRNLQNAPSAENQLTSILEFLLWALRKDMALPESFDEKVSKLVECLKNHRCLLILDNVETILSSSGQTGQCQPGYEGYDRLFKAFGEVPHHSCVLLTSREKPRELLLLEGEKTQVRSLQLRGLNPTEGRELFLQKGSFTGTQPEWQRLIEHYGGNPLALKMVAAATQELFDDRIASILDYIKQGALISFEIRDLLEQQFNRLSLVEKEIMYWLAINQEPVSFDDLAEDVVISSSKRQLPQAIASLLQRSLIEKNNEYFLMQPLVMEYTTQRLVEQVCKEIRSWGVGNREWGMGKIQTPTHYSPLPTPLLQTHALIKKTGKDYIRETQKQLIVQPLLEKLLLKLGCEQKLVLLLKNIRKQQKHQAPILTGYAGENIVNLLAHLQVDCRGMVSTNQQKRVNLHEVK